jgi:hypothetical protein
MASPVQAVLEKCNAIKIFQWLTWSQGCQIFLDATCQNGKNIPNDHKIYKLAVHKIDQISYKIYQLVQLQGILGLKIYHLATLLGANPVIVLHNTRKQLLVYFLLL